MEMLYEGCQTRRVLTLNPEKMFRVSGTEFSNPILASWTTAFIRSVIGNADRISLS